MEQSDVSEIVEDCASGLHYRIRRAQGQPIARVLLLHGVIQ